MRVQVHCWDSASAVTLSSLRRESLDSGGKLAGAADCHRPGEIVEADWLHSKHDAALLHCQYALINKLSKGAGVGKKLL